MVSLYVTDQHSTESRQRIMPAPRLWFTPRRYGPKLGVRTLDSLHVACALELKAERFWTFDERQAKLARVEGLKTT